MPTTMDWQHNFFSRIVLRIVLRLPHLISHTLALQPRYYIAHSPKGIETFDFDDRDGSIRSKPLEARSKSRSPGIGFR
jgi:hypothetical protein